jgi:hypothetical protein
LQQIGPAHSVVGAQNVQLLGQNTSDQQLVSNVEHCAGVGFHHLLITDRTNNWHHRCWGQMSSRQNIPANWLVQTSTCPCACPCQCFPKHSSAAQPFPSRTDLSPSELWLLFLDWQQLLICSHTFSEIKIFQKNILVDLNDWK